MFFLYYTGIPVLLTIMGKANWFYSQKIVGKITVFDRLNYPEFQNKKKSKGSGNQDSTVFVSNYKGNAWNNLE